MDEALQMPTTIELNNKGIFKEKLEITKKEVTNNLKSKLEKEKIELILQKIKDDNILFNFNGTTLKELKEEIKNKLTGINYNRAVQYIDETEKELDNLLGELEKGSTSAFKNYIIERTKKIKDISSATSIALASRTALILAPTLGIKIAIAGAIAGVTGYKLIKEAKYKKVISREIECNRVIEKLELTFDKNGKIIDTRFSQSVQELIRDYFKENKINFIDTGYLSLREQIYNLDFDKKLELANRINNAQGNRININSIINNKDKDFFEKAKNSVKRIASTTEAAIIAAIGINSIDPSLAAGPINGILGKSLVEKITNKKLLSNIIGISSGIGTKIFEHIPIIGNFFEKAFAIENIGVFAAAGLGIGTLSLAGLEIINILKNITKKYKTRKDKEKIMKLDKEKYEKDNEVEFTKMQETLSTQKNPEEQVIIDLLIGFAKENSININPNTNSVKELEQQIKKLNDDDKKKINKYLQQLTAYNNSNKSEFTKIIMKIGKILTGAAIIGLAGMSIYDLIKGGEFLTKIGKRESLGAITPENISSVHTSENGFTVGGGGKRILDKINKKEPLGVITPENISSVHTSGNGFTVGGGGKKF